MEICRVRGKEGEQRDKCLIFFLCRICFICSFEFEGERRTRLRRGLIIIENIVITLKLEINELNSLTER